MGLPLCVCPILLPVITHMITDRIGTPLSPITITKRLPKDDFAKSEVLYVVTFHSLPGGGGGGGVLGLSFAGYVPLASQSPCPIIVYFVANYRPHLSHFLGKCNFRNPN